MAEYDELDNLELAREMHGLDLLFVLCDLFCD